MDKQGRGNEAEREELGRLLAQKESQSQEIEGSEDAVDAVRGAGPADVDVVREHRHERLKDPERLLGRVRRARRGQREERARQSRDGRAHLVERPGRRHVARGQIGCSYSYLLP